jgi:NTE family protein
VTSAIIIASFIINTAVIPANDTVDTPTIRIGLALSGGAALGLAHIGVLKVLEREGIEVCCVAGTSMGSLVGGLYSAGYSAAQLESIAVNAELRNLFSSSIPFGAQYLPERQRNQRYTINLSHKNFIPALPGGIIPLQNVEFLLMRLLSNVEYNSYYNFDNLPIPYRAVAVDLVSGDLVVLKSGRLEQAIRASIAIPGVFAPENIDSLVLVDGGVQRLLPVEPLLEFSPDIIIASITRKGNEAETGIELIDVVSRTMDLINLVDLRAQTALADVVITPDVNPFLASDFGRARELIAAGEQAAEEMLPQIREEIAAYQPRAKDTELATRPMPIIESIRFEGLETTRPSVLSNAIRTRPGTELDFGRLIDDLVNLYNTGLFLNVNYRIEPTGDTTARVVYMVREQDYGFYSLGIRYDNADNILLGFALGQGNLWGSGASIRGVINVGNPREIRLGLTGTRLFAFPFGYRLDLFSGTIERRYYESGEWQSDYKNDYYGTIAEVGYILGHNAFFNLGLDAHYVRYQFPELPVLDTLPKQEWVVGPVFNLEFNSFDDLQLPTRGAAMRMNITYSSKALKSQNEFLKLDFSLERYIPISSRFLLHPGIDLGMSFGTLSWSNYFFTNPEKFLGFKKEERTTEQISSIRLGVDFKLFNLLGQPDYPFYLQLLSDVCTFTRLTDLPDLDNITSQLHWGLGIGARTNTPIGPFHLIIGAVDHGAQTSENIEVNYYISIGREFRYTK